MNEIQPRLTEIEAQKAKLDQEAVRIKAEAAARADERRKQAVEEAAHNAQALLSNMSEEIRSAESALLDAIEKLRERAAAMEELRTEHAKLYKEATRAMYAAESSVEEIKETVGKFERFPCQIAALHVEQDRRDSRPFVDWINDLRNFSEVRRAERVEQLVIFLKRGSKPYRLINGDAK